MTKSAIELTNVFVSLAVIVPTAAVVALMSEIDSVLKVSILSCFDDKPATSELTVARTSKASFNPAVFAMVSDPSAMVGVDAATSVSTWLLV